MPTSPRDPGNEGTALGADVTPEMDAFHRDWSRTWLLNSGVDPQLVAQVFGGPAPPDNNPPPQTGPNLDLARQAAAAEPAESISRNEGPNLDAARAAAMGGEDSDPYKHSTYLGRVKDIPGDIVGQFKSAVGSMEQISKEADTSTVAGRAKGGLKMAGALANAAMSPVLGAAQSMIARPLAERFDIERKDTPPTAQEMHDQVREGWSGYGKLAKRATPHMQLTQHEPEPASEEKVANFTDAVTFVLPGTGLINYGRLGRGALAAAANTRLGRAMSPGVHGEPAAATLRQAGGYAARDTEVTRVELEQHQRALQALPEDQRLSFVSGAVEGGPAAINAIASRPLRNLAGEIRRQMQIRESHLRQLPSTSLADYIDNYFPHMWQDPNRVPDLFGAGGAGRTGSGASLHGRTIPTVADGLAQGLTPVTNDPLDMVMRYVQSIDKFIYFEAARQAAIDAGEAVWVRPHTVGASGHPMGYNAPDGWTKLAGRGSTRADGAQLFAPEGFATVWNRGLSPGFSGPLSGPLMQGMQQASNFVTMTELGLSGYHALTMATESWMSQASTALANVVGGAGNRNWRQFFRGAGQAASWPVAPLTSLYRGRQFERAYLGLSPGSPDMNRMINRMERAGGRATGTRHANIQSSQFQNYWQVLRRSATRAAGLQGVGEGVRNVGREIGRDVTSNPLRVVARTFDSIGHALFNVAIPKIKNAAFYREAEAWIANHPNATQAEVDRGMRMVWDSIDNRFGELVQDNLFWDRRLKQSAQIMMRSFSWNLGTLREIGGGVADLARGRGPTTSTRAAYVLVMPVVYATSNAIYQYLMTGEGPKDMDDLIAPRTGGTAPGPAVPSLKPFGRSQVNQVPERVQIPGYAKDVFGWYFDPAQEAVNKLAALPRAAGQLATNEDYRGLPIFNPDDSVPGWLKTFAKYVGEAALPISVRQVTKGQKEGSKVGLGQSMAGIRPASSYLQDTEAYEEAKRRRSQLNWKKKTNIDRRQQQQYGGTDE